MSRSIRLVSLPVCPYVQRARIVLEHKQAEYTITYLDPENKPDWFLAISPRGKVPLLIVEDLNEPEVAAAALFESHAICEYVEETEEQAPLMPEDPFLRARDRAWFAYTAEALFAPVFMMMTGRNQRTLDKNAETLKANLLRLQQELHGDWLSGDGSTFGMADAAAAPAFTRITLLEKLGAFSWPDELAAMRAWGQRLLALPAVQRSVPDDIDKELKALMARKKALLAQS